jgi:hypothetical protein
LDNVFVERLVRCANPTGRKRLTEYVVLYATKEVPLGDNRERTQQSLSYSMPDEVYRTARDEGASIADKFREREKPHSGTEQD